MTLAAGDAGAGPLLVGWARLAVAAPCLLAAAALFRARPAVAPARGDALALVAAGAAMAAYQVCYFTAVTLAGVAVAALLAICSAPLMIALLAALFLGERLTSAVRAVARHGRAGHRAAGDRSARPRRDRGPLRRWARCSPSAPGYLTPSMR